MHAPFCMCPGSKTSHVWICFGSIYFILCTCAWLTWLVAILNFGTSALSGWCWLRHDLDITYVHYVGKFGGGEDGCWAWVTLPGALLFTDCSGLFFYSESWIIKWLDEHAIWMDFIIVLNKLSFIDFFFFVKSSVCLWYLIRKINCRDFVIYGVL